MVCARTRLQRRFNPDCSLCSASRQAYSTLSIAIRDAGQDVYKRQIYGIALVLIIILEPKGVLHMLEKMTQRIGKMLKQRSSQK